MIKVYVYKDGSATNLQDCFIPGAAKTWLNANVHCGFHMAESFGKPRGYTKAQVRRALETMQSQYTEALQALEAL